MLTRADILDEFVTPNAEDTIKWFSDTKDIPPFVGESVRIKAAKYVVEKAKAPSAFSCRTVLNWFENADKIDKNKYNKRFCTLTSRDYQQCFQDSSLETMQYLSTNEASHVPQIWFQQFTNAIDQKYKQYKYQRKMAKLHSKL